MRAGSVLETPTGAQVQPLAKLDVELVIRMGRGYVPAERNKREDDPVGTAEADVIKLKIASKRR